MRSLSTIDEFPVAAGGEGASPVPAHGNGTLDYSQMQSPGVKAAKGSLQRDGVPNKRFFLAAQAGDEATRNQLIENYFVIIQYQADKLWARLPDGVDKDDLISKGVFGMIDAIRLYNVERGVKFDTYCVPRIRGAMLDELREQDWVPRLVRSKASKLQKAYDALDTKLGRPPTEEEMAEHMGLSSKELEKLMRDAESPALISLNKKWYETDSYKDVREIDILENKRAENPTEPPEKQGMVEEVIKGMNREERTIMLLYYWGKKTMKQVGVVLDLSESRVSQMHSTLIQRLQGRFERHELAQMMQGISNGHDQTAVLAYTREALFDADPKLRAVPLLREQGRPNSEIAGLLEIPVGEVTSILKAVDTRLDAMDIDEPQERSAFILQFKESDIVAATPRNAMNMTCTVSRRELMELVDLRFSNVNADATTATDAVTMNEKLPESLQVNVTVATNGSATDVRVEHHDGNGFHVRAAATTTFQKLARVINQ